MYVDDMVELSNSKPLWNLTAVDRLRHVLLTSYDKFARPHQHYNKTTVRLKLSVHHIELDEFRYTFTAHGWIRLVWTDNKLKWNASDYEDVSIVRMADHEIWQPDLMLYNSAAGSSIDYYGNTLCLVYENGEVLWVPPAQFVAFCSFDLRYWPFDTQQCALHLGSWTYSGNEIDLQLNKEETEVTQLVDNAEWELVNVSAEREEKYYSCCDEPYVCIKYKMTVQRRSPTYKALIITPTFAIVVMTLLSFLLPSDAGEKILLNCSTAIIICIFLLFFTQKCPAMGEHTPLIVKFYSSSLCVVSFGLMGSVCVLWVSRTRHQRPLPWLVRRALAGRLGHWLRLEGCGDAGATRARAPAKELRDQQPAFEEHHSSDEHHILSPAERPAAAHSDWLLLATALDRLSFAFYTLLFAVLALAYSV